MRLNKRLLEVRRRWTIEIWKVEKNIPEIVNAFREITTDAAYKIIRDYEAERSNAFLLKNQERLVETLHETNNKR